MLFNTDHLDSKFDSLTLRDSYKQENINNDDMHNAGQILNMKQSMNGDTLAVSNFIEKPKASLLSSSLAEERQYSDRNTMNSGSDVNENSHMNIDESMDIGTSFMDDHPEPILLASSVGKEIDGHIIPSSSTISLLSLSAQNNDNGCNSEPDEHNTNTGYLAQGNIASQKGSNNQFSGNNNYSHLPSNVTPQTAFVDRKPGHNHITSRNSLTHLNQIRLQQYQKLQSPSAQLTYTPQQDVGSIATCQSIPIENKLSMVVPDSPNLDPTSIGGSPSGLWLSNQAPSRSSVGSTKNNAHNQVFHVMQPQQTQYTQHMQSNHPIQPTQPLHTTCQLIHNTNTSNNYTTTSTANYLKIDGSTSPILHPVQTPSEDPPMTPLYLNSNSLSQDDVGYFGNFTE